MLGLIALAGLLMGGFAVAAILGVVMFALKIVFWTIFLPFRILSKIFFKVIFRALMFPIWLTVGALGMAASAVAMPVMLVVLAGVAIIGVLAALFALLLPLLPFVMFGLLIWAFMRKRPAVVA